MEFIKVTLYIFITLIAVCVLPVMVVMANIRLASLFGLTEARSAMLSIGFTIAEFSAMIAAIWLYYEKQDKGGE